jgi:hypothetical protein
MPWPPSSSLSLSDISLHYLPSSEYCSHEAECFDSIYDLHRVDSDLYAPLAVTGPSLGYLCFKLIPIYAQQEIRVISNAGLRNIDAPVYSLPDEILALIFEEKLEMVFTRDEIDKGPPFEVVVSHINCRWRRVAINLGSLHTLHVHLTPRHA